LRTWQTVPNTAMAVAADTGGGGVHPRNKQDVALRLCLAARAIAYGEKIVYSGPIYRKMKIEGGRVRLLFDHVGGGLIAKRGDLKYFEVAGKDGKFHPATATIDGKTILVGREKTPSPVAARYAWRVNPLHCNLYNKENIAASPFRTDGLRRIRAKANSPGERISRRLDYLPAGVPRRCLIRYRLTGLIGKPL
jgi:sialate O-acetylesterase